MSSQPLRILLVAEDRRLLRQLSRFLCAFGYPLRQVANPQQAAALLGGQRPDLLIVDADPELPAALELCRLASASDQHAPLCTLLLTRQPAAHHLRQALEAGVDDFLAKPVVYGELLVRLQAAARMLQFERRLRQQADVEAVTGLPGRAALERWFQRNCAAADSQPPVACVLMDVDFLGHINHLFGHPAGDAVLRNVAEKLKTLWASPGLVFGLGGGQFALLLPDTSASQAATRAEQVRQALADAAFAVGEVAVRLTVSLGVAAVDPADRAIQQALERAAAALQTAKSSGRDSVVSFGQFDADTGDWTELAAPGKLFERTVARDVMTPWTLQLHAEQTVREAVALMRHARLQTAPVVDANGKYVGVLSDSENLGQIGQDERRSKRVAEAMATDVPHCEEQTSFSRLMEVFTCDTCSLVVILHDDRPTGFVTADSLASLGKPATTDSCGASGSYSNTSDYLRIPDELAPQSIGQ